MSKLNVWYEEGLKFKCTECGKCCTGAPGYVWLSKDDIEQLCTHLNLSEKEFLESYTVQVENKYSLRENPITYDCIFLKGKACTVYKNRPQQCKKFPFWPDNLKSKASWDALEKVCEGINHEEGKLYTKQEILE